MCLFDMEVFDIVKRYISPEDYFWLVCVSKEFHKIFKEMEGPVKLVRLLRDSGINKRVARELRGPELLGVLSRVFDGYQPNGYHSRYFRDLRRNLMFDGLLESEGPY